MLLVIQAVRNFSGVLQCFNVNVFLSYLFPFSLKTSVGGRKDIKHLWISSDVKQELNLSSLKMKAVGAVYLV